MKQERFCNINIRNFSQSCKTFNKAYQIIDAIFTEVEQL